MIFSNHDIDVLKKINPCDCESYLELKLWNKIGVMPNKASIWEKLINDQLIGVWIPINSEMQDYVNRMIELVELLSKIENRALESIIADILNVGMDTIIITLFQNKPDSNLSLINASELMKKSVNMVAAAAQAVMQPKAYYSSKYPKEVNGLLNEIKLGHTERGSFIISLHLPITPQLKELPFSDIQSQESPFGRKVIAKIAELAPLAIRAANNRSFGEFSEAIPLGLSANFCEALADISKICGDDGVKFSFAWSITRPTNNNLNNEFFITPYIGGILRDAAKNIRETNPVTDSEISGYVIRLDSEDTNNAGDIIVKDILPEKPRNISIKLDATNYQKAIIAHQNNSRITLYGDLDLSNKTYILTNVSRFELEQEY
jgi:hypothetical protein